MVGGDCLKRIDNNREYASGKNSYNDLRQKPTIVHIISGLDIGGAEMMLCKLLSTSELSCFRHNVISLGEKGILANDLEAFKIPVYAAGWQKNQIRLGPIRTFYNALNQIKPDIVQGWMYHGNLAAIFALLSVKKKIPILWNIRHTPYDLGEEKWGTAAIIRLGSILSRIPQCIIYNAETSANLHVKLGFQKMRQIVIPNGFDLERFKSNPDQRRLLRNELGLKKSAFLIGLIARYHPVKGHLLFLRAAALLAREFSHLHFILVGSIGEMGLKELRGRIQEEGLLGRVHILGERRDISNVMAGLDLVASASSTEAFPNVIGEAMACEVPCVVTDIGDCAQLVGDTGIAVSCESVAIAAGIAKLVRMDSNERCKLGRAARNRIVDHFSLHKIADSYSNLYWQVLNGIRVTTLN